MYQYVVVHLERWFENTGSDQHTQLTYSRDDKVVYKNAQTEILLKQFKISIYTRFIIYWKNIETAGNTYTTHFNKTQTKPLYLTLYDPKRQS